jgi:4-hydroxy-tetrahydrodipicolinate synthase
VRELQEGDFRGIDGVLSVCPYYNKPSQEGLYQHYRAIAEVSPLPVVLYNVPGRTGVNLEAETTLRIARDCQNVVAVKEASGKLEQIHNIIANAPAGFEVLSGDDGLTLDIIRDGGVGVISVLGNVYPAEFKAMVHAM